MASWLNEKTKPIRRPSAGNLKFEIRNPKQTRISEDVCAKQSQFIGGKASVNTSHSDTYEE